MSQEYYDIPFISPWSWSSGRKPGLPRAIVVHYTAGHEGPTDAENGAAYDGRRRDGTSAHYHVDSNSVVQCVYTWDEAHTARSRGNDIGIHYELAGTKQTRAQWLDPVSDATITNAARQAARDAKKYGIPVRRLSVAEVRASHPDFGNKPIKGFCGHADITRAFPEDNGDHLDPGEEFPWDVFLSRVDHFLNGGPAVTGPMNPSGDLRDAQIHNTERYLQALTELRDAVDISAVTPERFTMVSKLAAAILDIQATVKALAAKLDAR